METDRAYNCIINTEKRPQRAATTWFSANPKRHLMDFANRCSLEGSAPAVSAVPNVPSALPAMGSRRNFPTHCPRAGRRPVWTRPNWYSRGVHRRLLRAGKKRGLAVGKTKRGKGTKILAIADACGLPVAAHVESASPHEVKLVEATIDSSFTRYAPDKLVGDKAYDSDSLDQQLFQERGVEMIAPHRRGRKKFSTQDGRKLRRYRRRWKVERLFAWLQNFRRLVVRYEYHAENFLGMVQLGCIIILLRFFWDGF